MTYDDYWYGDPVMAKYYIKSYQLKQKQRLSEINTQAWLQGYYNYIALVDASPTFNSLKPSKPLDYLKEPIALTKEEIQAKKDRERNERLMRLKEIFSNSAKNKK